MATVTPNFNWPVPTSTDLVKDGATAIEALGDSIDASLVDLKGGTTGQVLSKTSGTDMDFTWVTSDDANAIQNTIVDAKGDLISASAADTPARLTVGANGKALIADSSTSTGLAYEYKGYTLISTTTLTGASVALTSIPSTYKSLKLLVYGMTNATANGNFILRCNGNGASHWISGQEGATNYAISNGEFATQAVLSRSVSDNVFVFDFDFYTGFPSNQTISAKYFYVAPSSVNTPGGGFGSFNGNTITSITILNSGGNFSTGTALLYGVA